MKDTFSLGRIRGIKVGVNIGVVIIAALLLYDLARGELPHDAPGHATALYWVVATAVAVLFFGSVLAHELGHALVARAFGVRVKGITLWLLGGVSRLDGEIPSARAERWIAVSGPAVSLLAGALFAGLAVGVRAFDVAGAVWRAGLWWLALINLLLAAFNLIPAAPLDGGRILAGVLWGVHGDQHRAERTAALVGRGFGWILVGVGVFQLMGPAGLAGIWTVLVGWFVLAASGVEGRAAALRARVGSATVAEAMDPHPYVARGWLNVETFVREELPALDRPVFVVGRFDGSVAGVCTVARVLAVPEDLRYGTRLASLATAPGPGGWAKPDEKAFEALLRVPSRAETLPLLVADGHGGVLGLLDPAHVRGRVAAAGEDAGTRPAAAAGSAS